MMQISEQDGRQERDADTGKKEGMKKGKCRQARRQESRRK